ncbi:MAG: GldG family protein [Hyphomicrobiales bacterium]|nr:GldG family protein [Hyphomicrobiales bacterium]
MTTPADNQNSPKPASRKGISSGWLAIIGAVLAAVIFGCVNLMSSALFKSDRVDLTQQHLFSLSEGTKTLVGSIKEPIRFRFFMSSKLTKEAPQLAAFAQRVRAMLDAYVASSHGKIVLEVVDPKPFSEDEDRAVAFGITPYRASGGDQVFFGLAVTDSTDGSATIKTFSPERESFLEYDLTRLVAQLGTRGKPVIALFDGLGLYGNPRMRIPVQQSLSQIQQFFDVQPMAGDVDKLPEKTKIVMIVHPQSLTERSRLTIDQWALKGGATMIFVDPWAENQMGYGGRPPADASSDMPKLFKAWGVGYDKAQSSTDLKYAMQANRMIDGRPVTMINLPWMALRGEALNKKEAILAQLQALVVTNAGAFTTTKADVSLRPLVSLSSEGGLLPTAKMRDRNADLRALVNEIKKGKEGPVIAARLTGKLTSAFTEKPKDSKFEGKLIAKSTKDANVILVADADMLMDRNWVQKRNILGTQVAQAFANNGDFVINALEQMAGGAALTDLRGRGVSWRPFERIQAMEAEASKKYSAKEQQLTKKLKDTQAKLAQLSKAATNAKANGKNSNAIVTPDQLKAVEKFKAELLTTREELRTVQFELRRDVDNLKSKLTALNVGGVPLAAGAIALLIALWRPRRQVPTKKNSAAATQAPPDQEPPSETNKA